MLCTWRSVDECAKPFIYKGVTYVGCTDLDHPTPWCSHDQVHAGAFSVCTRVCTEASPPAPAPPPATSMVPVIVTAAPTTMVPAPATSMVPVPVNPEPTTTLAVHNEAHQCFYDKFGPVLRTCAKAGLGADTVCTPDCKATLSEAVHAIDSTCCNHLEGELATQCKYEMHHEPLFPEELQKCLEPEPTTPPTTTTAEAVHNEAHQCFYEKFAPVLRACAKAGLGEDTVCTADCKATLSEAVHAIDGTCCNHLQGELATQCKYELHHEPLFP